MTNNPYGTVKDDGTPKKEEIPGGGLRQGSNDRYDLISAVALQRLARHYGNGAVKYVDHNWRKGITISGCIRAIMSHTVKLMMCLEDEDHAAAVAWNAFAIIETLERIKTGSLPAELDDRWKPE